MPAQLHDGQERGRLGTRRPRESERRQDTPIDWTHLSRFTMDDKALQNEVLGLFAKEAPRYLARLQIASNRKDWIEAAHTLKGSARAVGAWAIAECAQAAEALQLGAQRDLAVEAHALPGARQALEQLNLAVQRTLAYIEETAAPQAAGLEVHPG